jgi:hypothetical protein
MEIMAFVLNRCAKVSMLISLLIHAIIAGLTQATFVVLIALVGLNTMR